MRLLGACMGMPHLTIIDSSTAQHSSAVHKVFGRQSPIIPGRTPTWHKPKDPKAKPNHHRGTVKNSRSATLVLHTKPLNLKARLPAHATLNDDFHICGLVVVLFHQLPGMPGKISNSTANPRFNQS